MPVPSARALIAAGLLAAALALPLGLAAASPLLAYRSGIYIGAGFAGVIALWLTLVQPVLASGRLPGLTPRRARLLHRWTGMALLVCVVLHVTGLWITSPPDMIDALTFTSPTPFSAWGVIAMWAIFATALLATMRRRLRPKLWQVAHTSLGLVIAVGGVLHALLIEGTMETGSKLLLSTLVLLASARIALDLVLRHRAR